jgi:hypothetical protein
MPLKTARPDVDLGAAARVYARGGPPRWLVSADDQRLTCSERAFVRQLGNRLYGTRQNIEARHG